MTGGRQLSFVIRTWGGSRRGAGRKPLATRRNVPHRPREAHEPRCPAHVTLRALPSLRSLRSRALASALQDALAASSRNGFRVLQFSIQKDHLHLITEADSAARFALGVQGLSIRLARAINRLLARHGRVWADRYQSRLLRTPREVRNALVYVLNNVRKHVPGVVGIDPCSSARWFGGWSGMTALASTAPVAAARTWLAAVGWRRHGHLRIDEAPRPLC